jgi:xylulose-5-phosphate/fructose-6-phosphate phosphoketolase
MIILRSPKGWTGPAEVDGVRVTGTWRSHQVPLSGVKDNPEHLALLETWLKSYRPEELFDDAGRPVPVITQQAPDGDLRMSASPHANGGVLTRDLDLPDFRDYAVEVKEPARLRAESTRKLGEMIRDIYTRNPDRFRLTCPDETNSNRLGAVFEVSDRAFMDRVFPEDVGIGPDGRVMEVLSEHNCHGWLEGYNLTGRHGMFATYEAFAMVSASQTVQHGKWLEEAESLPWRAKVPASTCCSPRRRGATTTTASRTRAPGSSRSCSPSAATWPASTCRRTRTPCSRWPTTASGRSRTST